MATLAEVRVSDSTIPAFPGAPPNGGPLSPCAQVRQLGSAIGSLLISVCERTDTAFRRVHVQKIDARGNIISYPTNADGNIIDRRKANAETKWISDLRYIEDVKTGDLYFDERDENLESWCIVSIKCTLIVLGAPFYTAGKILSNIIRTPIEIGAIAFKTLYQVGKLLSQGECLQSCTAIGSGLYEIGETCGERLFEIIKAPIFGLGVELAALYGIFKPYHGRKFVAMIENAWQNGASYKNDVRNIPECSNNSPCEMFNRPCYLAYCFQVRGDVNDPRITVIRRELLSRW